VTTTKAPTHWDDWYWETFDPEARHAGGDLAALRRGIGRKAGDVPEMWRYYRSIVSEVSPNSPRLTAEHAALSLFATHQQSQRRRMHEKGTGLGTAVRKLSSADAKFSAEAIDRRMHQAATATGTAELVSHLRGLVSLLRTISQPLDYTRLRREIEVWHHAASRARVRAQWGSEYFRWTTGPASEDASG
jgi:CRISPR system Cascade subunit CasB